MDERGVAGQGVDDGAGEEGRDRTATARGGWLLQPPSCPSQLLILKFTRTREYSIQHTVVCMAVCRVKTAYGRTREDSIR